MIFCDLRQRFNKALVWRVSLRPGSDKEYIIADDMWLVPAELQAQVVSLAGGDHDMIHMD